MNKLITASLKSKDVERLVKFPRQLMDRFELEIITWIAEYYSKYSAPPSIERLEQEFEDFIAIELEDDYIIDDIADQTVERKRVAYFISEMTRVVDEVRLKSVINESDVYQVMKTTTLAEHDDIAYTDYDRTKYFKRSSTRAVPFFAGVLNRAMGDLHAGDYALIIARLGTGKSLMTQWQAREWMLSGMKILFVSQEMLAMEIFSRIDGMVSSFNPLLLRGEYSKTVDTQLKVAQMIAKKSKGEIYAPKGLTSPEQISMSAKFFNVDVVIVDGVYQLSPSDVRAATVKWEKVSEVSQQLKQMAQQIELPLLATTQIKRVGRTEGFTPEDIAFADSLGQDADQIVALETDSVRPTRLGASLIKNRYGPKVSTLLDLDFDTMKLEEVR